MIHKHNLPARQSSAPQTTRTNRSLPLVAARRPPAVGEDNNYEPSAAGAAPSSSP